MSRDYTAAQVYEWIRHRGYLPPEQYNEFGHKLPTGNMGACMEALADALKEIEQPTAPPAKLERVWELIDAVNNDHLDKKQYRKLLDAAVVELGKGRDATSKRKDITPLPWRTDRVYCGYIWSGDKMVADFPMDEDEGTYLARMRGVGRGATVKEQQANAAYIVHACNHYDEAIRLLRKLAADIGGDQEAADFLASADEGA